ncbi:MAG: hypothetical protein JW932_16560 [Deltaproteobacteria bacterium]|nr:hypothetical protein [Deltaproteobacteria bacterium]
MSFTSVKIMQCAVAKSGQLKINCVGVGVGVILYNPTRKIAVGLHILAAQASTPLPDNPAKYANTAIPYAIDLLDKEGAKQPLSATIVGGAVMSGMSAESGMGVRVVDAVKDALSAAKLDINRDETGGSKIRSLTLNIETGEIAIQ